MSTLKTHNLQSPDAGSINIAMAPNAGMVVAGLSTYSNQINVGNNIKLGNAGVITATTFVGDLTGTASGNPTLTGGSNNRVVTATGANAITGESSFTYDGNGMVDIEGTGAAGIQIKTPNNTDSGIYFRTGSSNTGAISYLQTDNSMKFRVNSQNKMIIDSSGNLFLRGGSANWIVMGSSGDATSGGVNNNMNWIRGNQTNTQYNTAGGFHGFEVSGSEKFRIEADGNLVQNLSSSSGTSPYQDSHWYDREGGHYTLSATDDNSLTAVKTDSNNGYDDIVYKRVRMSKNCDIEFELKGNSPSGLYRHVGFVINGDGTGTPSNWDRLVFRSRPGNTNLNLVRLDKGGGGTGLSEESSDVPTFFDGTERHILIQIREKLVNVIVDGVVIVSEKTNADFVRSQGWFGFGIYEGGENAQVTIRNLTIRNKFQRPHWIVKATGVNVDVGSGNVIPFNSIVKASSSMSNTSDYNNGSYRFIVPLSGVYFVFVRAYRNSSGGSEIAFYVNGNVHSRFRPQPNGGDYIFHGSALIELAKGDYIDVRSFNGTLDNFYGNSGEQWSSWGGHLID